MQKNTTHITLTEVQNRFEDWRRRRSKKDPIPDALWDAAVSLNRQHSINRIARALRLNYTDLKERIEARRHLDPGGNLPTFQLFEVPLRPLDKMSDDHGKGCCIVQVEKPGGERIQVIWSHDGVVNPDTLGKLFWRERS